MTTNTEKTPTLLKSKDIQFHNLQENWTFYYLIPARANVGKDANWQDYLKPLHQFHTFEDFWAIIASIEPAAKLQKGCRYYIFKNDIQPLWENEKNLGGKEISLEFKLPAFPKNDKGRRNKNDAQNPYQAQRAVQEQCETKWINLCTKVLCNNTQYFRNVDKINGTEYNFRSGVIKVGIWTSQITDEEFQALEEDLHQALDYNPNDSNITPKSVDISLERIPK